MEVHVRLEESSDEGISMRKSSDGEDLLVRYPVACSEMKNESTNDHNKNDSKETNEFSLERKMSFKELRKKIEETVEVPRRGELSLVMENKDEFKGDPAKEITAEIQKDEKRDRPEDVKSTNGEPTNLHLSQIKIQKWVRPKINDSETLHRLKQVCGALEGDSMYHYENIDDFDDTIEKPEPPEDNHWRAIKSYINCKLQRNQKGVISRAMSCKGRRRGEDRIDLRSYLLGEISREVEIIECRNKGCTNFYDPWDVVLAVGSKDAKVWYDTIAYDPIQRKSKRGEIFQRNKDLPKSAEVLESEPKVNWWRRKRKTKKIKLFDIPPNSDPKGGAILVGTVVDDDTYVGTNLKSFKYECTTCLEGYNEDPEPSGPNCGHYTCKACLNRYFREQVQNMITRIECPRLDCKEKIDTLFILSVLDNAPLRNAYMKLENRRNKLDYEEESTSTEAWHLRKNYPSQSEEELKQGKEGSKDDKEDWIKNSKDYKRCPRCATLTEKYKYDGTCNIVECSFCRTKFCWLCRKKCNEGLHMFECPLYGSKTFSKRRRIANYVGYSAGLVVGVPLVGSIVIGTGAAALGALVTVGLFSPPVLLAREMHTYHKLQRSSAFTRRLSVIGGATLGVLVLPVLSGWGVYKTVKAASKKATRFIDRLLPLEDDPFFEPAQHSSSNVAIETGGLGTQPERAESSGDKWPADFNHKTETQVDKKTQSSFSVTNGASGGTA